MPSPLNKKSNYLRAKTAEPSIAYAYYIGDVFSLSFLVHSFFLFFFFFVSTFLVFVAFNLLARERGDNTII